MTEIVLEEIPYDGFVEHVLYHGLLNDDKITEYIKIIDDPKINTIDDLKGHALSDELQKNGVDGPFEDFFKKYKLNEDKMKRREEEKRAKSLKIKTLEDLHDKEKLKAERKDIYEKIAVPYLKDVLGTLKKKLENANKDRIDFGKKNLREIFPDEEFEVKSYTGEEAMTPSHKPTKQKKSRWTLDDSGEYMNQNKGQQKLWCCKKKNSNVAKWRMGMGMKMPSKCTNGIIPITESQIKYNDDKNRVLGDGNVCWEKGDEDEINKKGGKRRTKRKRKMRRTKKSTKRRKSKRKSKRRIKRKSTKRKSKRKSKRRLKKRKSRRKRTKRRR